MFNADKKTSFQKIAQNLEFQCIMDGLKLQILCVLLSFVLIEEKEVAYTKQVEEEEEEEEGRQGKVSEQS